MTPSRPLNCAAPTRPADEVVAVSVPHPGPEGLFHRYVDATPLGILLVDAGGVITFANAGALACFGYSSAELLGRPIETLLPEPLRETHVEHRNGYLDRPERRIMGGRNLTGRRKDGTTVPVAVGLNPLVDDHTCRVACTVMDLTEVLRAEKDLTCFFDLSLDLFCIASVDGYFLRVNPNFSRVLGYPEEVLLTQPWLDFVHPDDVPATLRAGAALARGEPVVRFRNRYQSAAGAYRWFEWSARSIPEERTIYATARDITEQVVLEEELLARERRERAILENTPAVVYVKDRDGRYEYVNQRHADLFSLDATAALGKRDDEIFPPEVAARFRANDRRVFETGQRITVHETVVHDDGVHTYVSTKFPLLDAQGRVCGRPSPASRPTSRSSWPPARRRSSCGWRGRSRRSSTRRAPPWWRGWRRPARRSPWRWCAATTSTSSRAAPAGSSWPWATSAATASGRRWRWSPSAP